MAPKQETHSERISTHEGQIAGFSTATDELKDATAKSELSILETSAKNDRKFLEIDKNAEERHAQLMAMILKLPYPMVTNPSPTSGGSTEPTRSDKGVLTAPEKAIPLRSAELQTPSYHGGSSGYSVRQKSDSPPKKLELQFEGKNPDDWIFRMEKCFSMNQT